MIVPPFLVIAGFFCGYIKIKNMKEILKQIEEHIDRCIEMGVLPQNYRETEEYNNLKKELRDGN